MKPTLDMFIFTAQLSRSLGFRGTVLLFLNYYATVKILRAVTPAFGRLAAVEAMLEGEYRTGMNRVGRESEEVAFYGGGAREKSILWTAYLRLIKHINSIYKVSRPRLSVQHLLIDELILLLAPNSIRVD